MKIFANHGWWRSLSERDRRLGWLVLLGTLGLLLWLGAWRPLNVAHNSWLEREQRAAAELAWIQQASRQVVELRGSGGDGPKESRGSQSMLALAEQTARDAGLGNAFRRGAADGDKQARVWLEGASFDGLMRWLSGLQRDYAITVDDASLDRAGPSGTVDARLLLVER